MKASFVCCLYVYPGCTKMLFLEYRWGENCAKRRKKRIKIMGIDKNIMWCYNITYLPMLWHNYAHLQNRKVL